MTPYIIALAALALLLARNRKNRSLATKPNTLIKSAKKSKTRHFAKSSTPKKHGSTLRHTTAINNNRKKEDKQ